jgi:hypothetical protein
MAEGSFDSLNQIDEWNFQQVKNLLGPATALPEDVLRLYDLHGDAIKDHVTTAASRLSGALIGGLCRKHLLLGTTAVFRMYSSQMFREVRGAAEAAGIAYAIQHDQEKLRIFREDDGTSEKRRAARNAFRPKDIFPDKEPIMKTLHDHYDISSERAHTNLISFIRHLAGNPSEKVSFNMQDFKRENVEAELPLTLFWMCQVHITILCAVDIIFPGLDADFTKFQQERKYVFDKVHRFNEAHKDKLPSIEMPN